MKRILIVDESQLFRDFLRQKLEDYGFGVTEAVNGLDGTVKLRQQTPDLVIMDYYLTRNSSLELLDNKNSDPNTASVPVIMASSRVDRDKLIQVAKYGVKKFFNKPIRVDSLLKTISEILNTQLDMDDTPCIIEAHFNEDILFVEVAQGLNNEKIELLKYKIRELLDLYEVKHPKVLLIMASIEVTADHSLKLAALLSNVLEYTQARHKHVKILTKSDYVKEYVASRNDLQDVEVTDTLERAMDGLLGRKSGSYMQGGRSGAKQEFLSASTPKKEKSESFQMRFDSELAENFSLTDLEGAVRIAVVDDDLVIQELIRTAFSDTQFEITSYNNGREFTEDPEGVKHDLVFLDLLMPEMSGFQVLEAVHQQGTDVPFIVLSALSKRDSVVKALQYGVLSYLVKPLQPESIRRKAAEVLRLNF